MTPREPRRPATVCPRCRHDLRGVVAAWSDACPLEGRCAECGLAWRWGDVVTGRADAPRWSIEAEVSWFKWLLRLPVQAAVAAFAPWYLFARLRLEHRIRVRRVVAGVAVLILCLIGTVVVPLSKIVRVYRLPATTTLRVLVTPWSNQPIVGWEAIRIPPPGDGRAANWDGTRLQWLESRAASGIPPVTDAELAFDANGHWIPGRTTSPWADFRTAGGDRIEIDLFRIARSGMAGGGPLTRATVDRIVARGQVPVVRPGARTMWRWAFGNSSPASFVVATAGPTLVALPGAALAFAVLPVARRRARVAWPHLGRLAALAGLASVTWAAVGWVGLLVFGWPAWATDAASIVLASAMSGEPAATLVGTRHPLAIGLWTAIPATLTALWWSWAAGRYLRMERPWAVGVSAALLTVCVVAVVGARILAPFV